MPFRIAEQDAVHGEKGFRDVDQHPRFRRWPRQARR
jgi:hypothetical protein